MISESEAFKCIKSRCKIYKNDLDKSFYNECLHFQSHSKFLKDKTPKNYPEPKCNDTKCKDLQTIYSYVDIALIMSLCTPATNCS